MVVDMPVAMIAVWLKIDEERFVEALQAAGEKLNGVDGEVALDFSAVRRVDASAVRAMERFASIADDKHVKVVLHGVNVGVYKVLKLVKLGSRFSFVS
jgi:anti-anti-sigma regulatory factor